MSDARNRPQRSSTRDPIKLIIAVVAWVLSVGLALADEALIGRASVIDGDTIEISGERIRLYSIGAPESWQICEDADGLEYRCGQNAAGTLDRFLRESRPTRCEHLGRDRYQRVLAICFHADGSEVNRWLVENGHPWIGHDTAPAVTLMRSSPRGPGHLGFGRGTFNNLVKRARYARGDHPPADLVQVGSLAS
jgi:succinoglycan biosynthesis protein ExoI